MALLKKKAPVTVDKLAEAHRGAAAALGLFDYVVDELTDANALLDEVQRESELQVQIHQQRVDEARATAEKNAVVAKRIAALTA